MRLLLDTHALIWWLDEYERLSPLALEAIASGEHDIIVSHASIWEIAIKHAKGKVTAPEPVVDRCVAEGFKVLPIAIPHILALRFMPPFHGDPFDRMLVAQARVEDLTLMTRDANVMRYDVKVLSA